MNLQIKFHANNCDITVYTNEGHHAFHAISVPHDCHHLEVFEDSIFPNKKRHVLFICPDAKSSSPYIFYALTPSLAKAYRSQVANYLAHIEEMPAQ